MLSIIAAVNVVVVLLTLSDNESVGDVSGVVDAEPDGQDDVDAGERVDGDGPEVQEADDVDQSEEDANLNNNTEVKGQFQFKSGFEFIFVSLLLAFGQKYLEQFF